MALINPSIPIIGQSDSTEDPKIVTALNTLVSTVNALDSANIVDGSITPADLATNAKPATLLGQFGATPLSGLATLGGAQAAGTYWLSWWGGVKLSGAADGSTVPFVALGSGGYAVAGLTAMARVVCSVMVNNTAPVCNFTFGLHQVTTIGGGASQISFTSSGALAGSTAAINAPAANTGPQAVSADFALPTSSLYALAVVTSAPIATSSLVQVTATLQVHWV